MIIRSETYGTPGLYRMSESAYHGDLAFDGPSLSRSIAEKLITQSPAHAWRAHPKLGLVKTDEPEKKNRKMDIGSAAHALLLHQNTPISIIDAKDYMTGAAKAKYAEAVDGGAVPLLKPDHALVEGMVAFARSKLAGLDHPALAVLAHEDPFDAGHDDAIAANEVTALWRDRCGDLPARARIDRLYIMPDRITIIDYKTTQTSAAPDDVSKAIYNNNYHFQDAFYRRGIRHLFPEIDRHERKLDFLFIVQEQEPPFEMTITQVDASGRLIGEKMVSAAFLLWRKCMADNVWPGYPTGIVTAECPPYVDTRWSSREIEDPRLQGLGFDPVPISEAIQWKAPQLLGAC